MKMPDIFEIKRTMYKYGIMFYNYKTDHELRFNFYAFSAFAAHRGTNDLKIDGYAKGEVAYIDNNNMGDWIGSINLFEYFPELRKKNKEI